MRRLVLVLSLLLIALAPAATAVARPSASDRVIRDCTDDGRLEGHYTQSQLKSALNSIPSDVDEYTNCRDVIHAAYVAGGSGGSGSSSGGGGTTSTPATTGDPLATATAKERAAVTRAAQRPAAVSLGKLGIANPDALGRRVSAGASDVPTPLLVAGILAVLAALAAAAQTVRSLVLARRAH
jgi:hypothetical protein